MGKYDKDEFMTITGDWGSETDPTESKTVVTLDTTGIDGRVVYVTAMWSGLKPLIVSLVIGSAANTFKFAIPKEGAVNIRIVGRKNFAAGDAVLIATSAAGTGVVGAAIAYQNK